MPQYSKLQFVAYETATFYTSAAGTVVVPPAGGGVDPLADARNISNLDARNRLLRFYEVIEHARTQGAASLGGTDTLKVCVTPEFYFRDSSSMEGYQDQAVVTNIFAALLAMFKQDNYKDWLFVPGSVFWSQTTPQSAYFNTVCVVRGRSADLPSGDATAAGVPIVRNGTTNQKALMSHIDYGYDLSVSPPKKIDKRRDDAAINPYFSPIIGDWSYKKGHLFEVQDILGPKGKPLVFGLEVCLEHAAHLVGVAEVNGGVLKQTLADWPQNEHANPVPSVDVHIVTSCGMPIQVANVCAQVGGHLLWCDGMNGPGPHSAIRLVTARNPAGPTLAAPLAEATHVDVQPALVLQAGGPAQTVRIYPATAL